MRLYLIRHGQSINNLLWLQTQSDKGRSYDPELTPTGHAQAECVARFLRDELSTRLPLGGLYNEAAPPTVLYTSLMTRAVQTGHIIARALNVPLIGLNQVFEIGGLFLEDEATGERRGVEGPNRAHFQTLAPDIRLPDELGERGWYDRPAELKEERPLRVVSAWNELVARHDATDDIVGLVTHGGFYNYLLGHLLQIPTGDKIWFALNNCAVSRIDVTEQGTALLYLNRFDFLPSALIT